MSRSTIDYGIDLGTTNSTIALVSGTGTEVIRNSLDTEITPSAVYINSAGNLWVGQSAKSRVVDERAEGDVFLEFKRRIGTGYEYVFQGNGRRMRPEELSAEVLKSLRADVAQKKGEDITAAVITVPAAFELHQCDATKKAAEIAGFKTSSLLQEPVAAALAFGYQKIDANAYWLVFDFGGGTFDAALIRSVEGTMIVANHGGDNFLGGTDIDWAIVDHVLAPRVERQFKTEGFKRGTERFRYDMLRLKAAAEGAKIDLSRKETTFLEATLREVSGGGSVVFETEISRQDIARAAEPIIAKSIGIARRVLAEKRLAPSAVERLIFVGGPTLAPYFRQQVEEHLPIAFDLTMDPLTVVAKGAAIFAGTQKIASSANPTVPSSGQFRLELIHKSAGADTEPLAGGKVIAPEGENLGSYTIEIVNQQSKWRSGKISLRPNGAFQLTVRAEKGFQNTFIIELRNSTGSLCEITPSLFKYTVGVVIDEQPIINNLGVALADNQFGIHFTKGQGLPAKGMKTYRTSQPLRRGQSGSVLKIPIIEGNRELADRNILIGTLEIKSDKIKRDLPGGSEIEVTLFMDTSRILTVTAYLPLLDEEFPTHLEMGGKLRQPDAGVMRIELTREKKRLLELRHTVEQSNDAPALKKLLELESSGLIKNLAEGIDSGGTDFDSLLKADRELLELKVALDDLAAQVEWPAALKKSDDWLGNLETLVAQHGNSDEKVRAKTLREQVRTIVTEKNSDRLKKKLDEISDVYSNILHKHTAFWVNHFESLVKIAPLMAESATAEKLMSQGREYVTTGRLTDLKSVVFQLQDLLPRNVLEETQRGYGSGLIG